MPTKKTNPAFSAAAKLVSSQTQREKFLESPTKYLTSKKLKSSDILKASEKIKALMKKNPASEDWW